MPYFCVMTDTRIVIEDVRTNRMYQVVTNRSSKDDWITILLKMRFTVQYFAQGLFCVEELIFLMTASCLSYLVAVKWGGGGLRYSDIHHFFFRYSDNSNLLSFKQKVSGVRYFTFFYQYFDNISIFQLLPLTIYDDLSCYMYLFPSRNI